ncbi:hypothetical protein [Chitinibacter sp. S2-10]|uniref:hypothetical protein n=1 Tax=Chitinibacter sp. S2-10 TaxID=3373597 RepID=UPI0039776290
MISILGLCILPILLAQAAWQWARPQGGESFGQLIAKPVLSAPPQRYWQLLAHTGQACNAAQPNQANQLRPVAQQLQRAQGNAQHRIKVAECLPLAQALPSGIYLIDPHGNAVLRYSPEQLAQIQGRQAALREIGKVLKNNQGLG